MDKRRIPTVDVVRGLVMIIMALDHVRDLMHVNALTQSPTDLSAATPGLFLSRWITHLCAPTFVFLAGVSVWLSVSRNNNVKSSRGHLLKRGLWLILLEFTLINFALWFDVQFRILMFQVIAAIGVGFIVMSVLLKASPRWLGISAGVILASHNLLQYLPGVDHAFFNILKNFLVTPGVQQGSPEFIFFISYPVIPWLAIMMLGYSFGKVFEKDPAGRGRILVSTGLACLAIFVVLRLVNMYGDPVPWKTERNFMFTVLSFLNVTKYPPSLLFTLLFLGLMFLALHFSGKAPGVIQGILGVYGRVPLFYYLLHLYLIRLSVFIMVFLQGYHWNELLFGPFQFGRPAGNSGIGLPGILIVWAAIVAVLYPLCKKYDEYKRTNAGVWWLKYI